MTALLNFRTAIVQTLSSSPRLEGVNVYTHGSNFDFHELKEYAKKAPAVFVAIERLMVEQQGGLPVAFVGVTAVVLAKDAAGIKRDAKALIIVQALLNELARFPNQFWGLSFVSVPQRVGAENLYSRRLDDEGVALWAVAWSQDVQLDDLPAGDGLDDFALLSAKWDLAPRDNDAPLGEVTEAEDLIDVDE